MANAKMHTLKQKIGKHLRRLWRRAIRFYSEFKYKKYPENFEFPVKINDMQFKFSFSNYPLDFAIVERIEGVREPETVAIINSLVFTGAHVVELGGCYGYFTAIMAACAGPQGKVLSIEGTPNNYKILVENIHRNNFNNVKACNYFVGESVGEVRFKEDEKNSNMVLHRKLPDNIAGTVSVLVRPLTSILEEYMFVPDIIFIDIEGFEIEVFSDLNAGYLLDNRPSIVFEIHEYKAKDKGLAFIKEILKRANYTYRRVGSNMICFPNNKNLKVL